MKKSLLGLALLGVLAVAPADAAWRSKVSEPLKWTKSLTSDSTTIALEWSGGVTSTGDTTQVVNLQQTPWHDWAGATSIPALRLHLYTTGADNSANSAAGDTMEVVAQYSFDGTYWTANSAVLAIGASPTLNKIFDVEVEASAPGLGAPFWRFILTHWDGSAQTTRQVTVRTITYEER